MQKKVMKQIFLLCILTWLVSTAGYSQHSILYKVDISVRDSLKAGVVKYEKMYKKKWTELNLAILVYDHSETLDLVLQSYLTLPQSGLSNLIRYSNRLLALDEDVRLPVLLLADRLSELIIGDSIAYIPQNGYHVTVVHDQGRQTVVFTGFTF